MAMALGNGSTGSAPSWRRRGLRRLWERAARYTDWFPLLRAASSAVECIRDIPYGPHRVAHRLDLYRPRYAPRPLPVLLYIHGGGFTICSKDTHRGIALLSAHLSEYLVVNINYRLAPRHCFPAAVEDACAAYRWIIQNIRHYGGDPERIVVSGESAGGNLALGVAIAACYRRPEPYAAEVFASGVVPRAVAPLMPYLQASCPDRHGPGAPGGRLALRITRAIAKAYLGSETARACPETLMADPIRILEQRQRPERPFPPVFSAVGTGDLCAIDVGRLEQACRALSIPVFARYYPNEMHVFHLIPWRAAARRFWIENLRFLRAVAGTSTPPPAELALDLIPALQPAS